MSSGKELNLDAVCHISMSKSSTKLAFKANEYFSISYKSTKNANAQIYKLLVENTYVKFSLALCSTTKCYSLFSWVGIGWKVLFLIRRRWRFLFCLWSFIFDFLAPKLNYIIRCCNVLMYNIRFLHWFL